MNGQNETTNEEQLKSSRSCYELNSDIWLKVDQSALPWAKANWEEMPKEDGFDFTLYVLLCFISCELSGSSVSLSRIQQLFGYENTNAKCSKYRQLISAFQSMAQIISVNGKPYTAAMQLKSNDVIQYTLHNDRAEGDTKGFLLFSLSEVRRLVSLPLKNDKHKLDGYFMLYIFIKSHMRPMGGQAGIVNSYSENKMGCWISYKRIHSILGLDHETIRRMVDKLQTASLIWSKLDEENRLTFYMTDGSDALYVATKSAFEQIRQGRETKKKTKKFRDLYNTDAKKHGVRPEFRKNRVG